MILDPAILQEIAVAARAAQAACPDRFIALQYRDLAEKAEALVRRPAYVPVRTRELIAEASGAGAVTSYVVEFGCDEAVIRTGDTAASVTYPDDLGCLPTRVRPLAEVPLRGDPWDKNGETRVSMADAGQAQAFTCDQCGGRAAGLGYLDGSLTLPLGWALWGEVMLCGACDAECQAEAGAEKLSTGLVVKG